MGFFRGSSLFILSILLLLSFFAAGSFLIVSTSLKYENVQKELGPVIQELSKGLNDENRALFNETAVRELLQDSYYKNYDCDFWDCFASEQSPFFLVSQKARDYWKEKFYYSLLISLFLIALIFFLAQNKLNWPILVGSILILSAIPLLKIKGLISLFIPGEISALSTFLNIFFSKAMMVFWISFILGLVLIGIGLGLKFSNADFVKKITEKQEAEKSKSKKK